MKNKCNLCLMALVIGIAFLLQNCSSDDPIENPIVKYKLTTDVTPAQSGSVSPSSGTFDKGTEISLTAIPASEYIFKNWSNGAVGIENPLSVIMNSDKNITAVFEKKNYSLSIVIEGEGTVTEEIIEAKSAVDYPSGTIVKLTAVPGEEWEFVEWSGDYEGTENPLQITIDEPINLTAKFEKKNYSLNIVIEGEGTVTEEIIEAKSAVDYPSGTIVKLTAVPSEDWLFVGWSGDYEGTENPLQLTIEKPTNLTATFTDSSSNKTYVPDDNFEQALIDLGYDNVLDNYVLTSNINTLDFLNIEGKEISDLTGIEDFIALTVLRCFNNNLTSLDISNNTALIDLRCYDNELTSLDISSNSALTYLLCFNNNLTSLTVGGATALTYLDCKNNALPSLDVSGATSLTYLDCKFNKLTSLDVRGATDLTYLECSNNELPSLDVSGAAALTTLKCHFNELASIDLSGATDLITLECSNNALPSIDISAATDLTTLKCQNNVLTSLDVSGATDLATLWCFANDPLSCIQVNSTQENDIPDDWRKDEDATYSTDCN